jgi:hypothetical protein
VNIKEESMYSGDDATVAAVILGLGFFGFLIILALYVLKAVGIMKLMDAKSMDRKYRAWIPFWNAYVVGSIIEDEVNDSVVVPGVTKYIIMLYSLLTVVPVIGEYLVFIGAIYTIVCYAVLAKKYGAMAPMIILSIIGLEGIGFILLGNKMMEYGTNPLNEGAAPDTVEFETVEYTRPAAPKAEAPAPAPEVKAEPAPAPKADAPAPKVEEVKAAPAPEPEVEDVVIEVPPKPEEIVIEEPEVEAPIKAPWEKEETELPDIEDIPEITSPTLEVNSSMPKIDVDLDMPPVPEAPDPNKAFEAAEEAADDIEASVKAAEDAAGV